MKDEKEKPKTEKKKEEKVKEEKKEEVKKPVEAKKEVKEGKKPEKKEEKKSEKKEEKAEEKKEDKKPEKKEEKKEPEIPKKEEAIAKGINLHVSKRHCMYICSFIKNKKIEEAINDLELVMKFKKAVPFKGEVPHRKGMMSGRYPIKASKLFINVLKALKGNIIVNGLDLDKTRIYLASASWAARPMRSGGRQAKRTNVVLKAKETETKGGKE